MTDLRALVGALLLVCGCGADFQAGAELTGGSGSMAGAAGAAGSAGAGAAGMPTAGSGGAAGAAGSASTGGTLVGQGGALGGAAGSAASGGAPPAPACSIAELDLRFLETFTWQDYTSESLGYCEVCRDTPCAQFPEIFWTYPFTLEGTTIEADVTVPSSPYITANVGECGSELTDTCNFKLHATGYFRFELAPTATGWKVASVESRASQPERTFTTGLSEVCSGPDINPVLVQNDIYHEFMAVLAAQTWECP